MFDKPKNVVSSETTAAKMTTTPVLTEYVVLQAGPKDDYFETVGKIEARSAKAAVAAHVKKAKVERGTFIAVPARSWVPVTVTTEQQIKFS